MMDCIAVGFGGMIGSILRYLAGKIPVSGTSGFPYKTMAINIAGSFVLGLISAWAAKNPEVSPRLVLMLKVGVCGGFTTFSTFAYESNTLLTGGKTGLALLYILASASMGILAVYGGQQLIH